MDALKRSIEETFGLTPGDMDTQPEDVPLFELPNLSWTLWHFDYFDFIEFVLALESLYTVSLHGPEHFVMGYTLKQLAVIPTEAVNQSYQMQRLDTPAFAKFEDKLNPIVKKDLV